MNANGPAFKFLPAPSAILEAFLASVNRVIRFRDIYVAKLGRLDEEIELSDFKMTRYDFRLIHSMTDERLHSRHTFNDGD